MSDVIMAKQNQKEAEQAEERQREAARKAQS